MDKKKVSLALLLLLALPGAMLELLNNVYNVYVPIYLQAGNPLFSSNTLTLGFGLGAILVGFWLTADNIFSFFVMPLAGAWSDRTRSRWGRRLPFLVGTLPLLMIGYALIPVIPTLIPAELSGQQSSLIGLFVAFTLCCVVYYLGAAPARIVLQALRQESVPASHRTKVESWYFLLLNASTIVAYTLGGKLYELYGPLIFWAGLALYVLSLVLLFAFFREPKDLSDAAATQENSNLKQLNSVIQEAPAASRRNLIFFLISVALFSMVLSSIINFAPSWAVNVLGVTETQAASIIAIATVTATVVALPFGYLSGVKLGKRKTYILSLMIVLLSLIMLVVMPHLYLVGFAVFGIGMAGTLTSQLPLASEIAYDQSKLGSIIGVYNLAYNFGFLLGANVSGVVIEATSYNFLFASVLVFITLGCIFAGLIRRTPEPVAS